jgi:hypothetical protein
MTIQQHASFDSSAAELNATSKLVKAWESKNAKNAAKAGGISLMALSLAACTGSSNDNDGEIQINEDAGGARDLNGAVGTSASPVYLSSNRDHGEFSGEAYAGEVWSPGGDTRVDSLGNEDAITGTGAADTLEATLAADDVAPILQGIETLDVDFIGSSAGQALDLEDSNGVKNIIVGRITNNTSATIDNINDVVESISVSNSGEADDFVNFSFNRDVLDGSADTLALTVNDVQVDTFSVDAEDGEGYETIDMTVSGASNLDDFEIDSTVTLNITATADLTVGDFDLSAGHLATIDASKSTSTADLDINLGEANVVEAANSADSGTEIGFTYAGGAGSDTIRIDEDSLSDDGIAGEDDGRNDTIGGGEGDDTLYITVTSDQALALTDAGIGERNGLVEDEHKVTSIETLRIDAEDDADAVDGDDENITTAGVDASLIGGLTTVELRNIMDIVVDAGGDAVEAEADFDIINLGAAFNTGGAGTVKIFHAELDSSAETASDTDVRLHLADASGDDDTMTVHIETATNTTETFNFTLDIDGNDADAEDIDDGAVENVTIVDNDTEDNTVVLSSVADHDDTLTLTGGREDDSFTVDGTVVATTVAATGQKSDVTLTLGTANQDVNMGIGDDTIDFVAADTLTDDDDVNGGDGDDVVIAEFTADSDSDLNLTGVETLQLALDRAAGVGTTTVDISESDDVHTINLMSDNRAENAVDGGVTDIINLIADNISTINMVTTAANANDVYNGLTITDEDDSNPAAMSINFGDAENDSVTVGVITLDSDTTSLTIDNGDDDGTNNTTMNGVAAAGLTSLVVTDSYNLVDHAAGDTDYETVINLDDTVALTSVDVTGAHGGVDLTLEAMADAATINLANTDDVEADANDELNITFSGDTGADDVVITGGAGEENIIITNGDMDDLTINTAGGNDEITLTGLQGDNIEVDAGAGNDTVVGTSGDDEITGGAGTDSITGAGGADLMAGGAGADTFFFTSGSSTTTSTGYDVITDFTVADDILDFAAGSTLHVADTADVDVATNSGNATDGDVHADIVDGFLVLSAESGVASDLAAFDTLAEVLAAVEEAVIAAEVGGAADHDVLVGFEFNGSTYIAEYDYTDGDNTTDTAALTNLVELSGLTGVTDLDTTAAANTVVIA